jgi:hypothetical protein
VAAETVEALAARDDADLDEVGALIAYLTGGEPVTHS